MADGIEDIDEGVVQSESSASELVLTCTVEDLDKPLNDDLKRKFWGLFYVVPENGILTENTPQRPDAWRMFYNKATPASNLAGLDIDI